MTRIKRTDAELKAAADNLFYEYWMFFHLKKGMSSGIFNKGIINNALLESFTLHTRILLDFLFSENPREDDVIAEDFFENPVFWSEIKTAKSDKLKNIKYRVGKEIAHLTYTRQKGTDETKQWDFVEIANEIISIFSIFLERIPQCLLSNKWEMFKNDNSKNNLKTYHIYENWRVENHKAKIHFSNCSFCNYGKGIHNTENETNGCWLGPFNSFEEAKIEAKKTGANISFCKFCFPKE